MFPYFFRFTNRSLAFSKTARTLGPTPWGPPPKKCIKKEAISSKNDDVWMFSSFPENILLGVIFQNGFSPKAVQPEAPGFREIQKPIWRYFVMKLPSNLPSNVEKWTFRCHVRPNPAKVRGNLFVWSMPSPRTPPDLPNINLNCEKNSFCAKQ